jgi:hypothetical protein
MIGWSAASVMVGRAGVDGWWNEGWFWSKAWGKLSSGWSRWLIHLGDIVRVVFGLKPRWAPILGLSSRSYVSPNTKVWVEGPLRGYEKGQR